MALVDGFLELERSSGKLEWSAILQKMASDLGFSKILFGLLPKDSQDYENAFIVGNYPAAWREHYDRAGYARVDPTVSHCTQSVLPIFWEPSIYQTRKQHEFFEEASAAGLVYGLTMPLHGARGELGALSLSVEAENRAEANRFMESVLPTLWMLKDYALQSGAGLAFEHPVSKPVVLTSREKEGRPQKLSATPDHFGKVLPHVLSRTQRHRARHDPDRPVQWLQPAQACPADEPQPLDGQP